jgi:hypothetical protein
MAGHAVGEIRRPAETQMTRLAPGMMTILNGSNMRAS